MQTRRLAVALVYFLVAEWLVAAAATVPITVRVRTANGAAIAKAYVALVPAWKPSNHPLVEEIAEKGISTFRVPPGAYWLIGGAPGFGITSRGPISVTVAPTTAVSLTLLELKPIAGTVTDDLGHPIERATVTTLNGTIRPPLNPLSELAVHHLSVNWSATTDRSGAWNLSIPDATVPLRFEAPGFASEWRIHRQESAGPVGVSLKRGAALKVAADRIDPSVIVTLSRLDSEATDPVQEQPRIWARWVTTQPLTWTSLLPGEYAIYAKYPEPRYFMQTAVKLATVTLAAGEERAIRITLPPVRRAATSWATLFLQGISRRDLGEDLETFGRNAIGDVEQAENFVEDVIGGTAIHVRTEGIRAPFHGWTKARFIFAASRRDEMRLEAGVEPMRAALYQRADARLQIRFAEKELQPPKSGLATLRDCGKGDPVVAVRIDLKENVGRFTAPAGCQGLVLGFDPFESVIPDKVLQPGAQSLGNVTLRGAGSADVHVVHDPSGSLIAGATVRATSDDIAGGTPRVVAEGITDERGWAHLVVLPAYRRLLISAEAADGEVSDTISFRARPRERSVVDPLAVPAPATLTVHAKIDPSFLTLFPASRVVAVVAQPADAPPDSKQQESPNAADATIVFDRLHRGRWTIRAIVNAAGTFSPMQIRTIDLKAGETQTVEAVLAPNIFEGVVTSKGVGVHAKVLIEDRGLTLNFNTDPAGNFRAALQSSGTYRVAVARLSAQGNVIPIGDVAFTDPSRPVEIAIPPGGTVVARVRSSERPLANQIVWISRRDESEAVETLTNRGGTTDAAGEARFDDLVPGQWTFSVRESDRRKAAEKSVAVESGTTARVDLDVVDSAAVTGTIRDLGGAPLPYAHVDCVFTGPSGNPDRASADSDVEGSFEVDLISPPPWPALCAVIGPMGTVDAFRSTTDKPSEITAPAATAAFQVSDWADLQNRDRYWLIAPDGRAVSLNSVAMRMVHPGPALTIPALAAGRWKIARIDSLPQWMELARGLGASLPAIADLTLRAGDSRTITLNESRPESRGR